MTEELLKNIDSKLGDMLALYKLLHAKEIEGARKSILGEGTRKRIYELCDGKTAVTEMAKELKISQPAVSQHIAVLIEAGLVVGEGPIGKRFYAKRLER